MLPEIAHMLAACVNHIAVLRVPLLAAELPDVSTPEARRDLFAARVPIQSEQWVKPLRGRCSQVAKLPCLINNKNNTHRFYYFTILLFY